MNPKVSIIIPICNGAKKIKKTVNGLLRQDYPNFELILVENGSTDNTLEICKAFEKKDPRVIAMHNNEKGTLLARKAGILRASGDYILFHDDDDRYINYSAVSQMVKSMETSQADVCQFAHISKYLWRRRIVGSYESCVISREQLLESDIAGILGGYNQKLKLSPWDKIYRSDILKEVIKDATYPLIYAEDLYLNALYFFSDKIKRVAFDSHYYYIYNEGIGVIGSARAGEKVFDAYQVYKPKAMQLAHEKGAGEKPIYLGQRESLRFLDVLVKSMIVAGQGREEIIEKIRKFYSYNFVMDAKKYFREYMKTHELDQDMSYFATEESPEAYYEHCLSTIPGVKKQQMKEKAKNIVKKIVRAVYARK